MVAACVFFSANKIPGAGFALKITNSNVQVGKLAVSGEIDGAINNVNFTMDSYSESQAFISCLFLSY